MTVEMAGGEEEEELRQLQETEVEVLEAIFGSNCTVLRSLDVWKKPRPPEILLYLLPENTTQAQTFILANVFSRRAIVKHMFLSNFT